MWSISIFDVLTIGQFVGCGIDYFRIVYRFIRQVILELLVQLRVILFLDGAQLAQAIRNGTGEKVGRLAFLQVLSAHHLMRSLTCRQIPCPLRGDNVSRDIELNTAVIVVAESVWV